MSLKMWIGVAVLFVAGAAVSFLLPGDGGIKADDVFSSALDDAHDEDASLAFESVEIKQVKPDGNVVDPDGRVTVMFRDPSRRRGDSCQGYQITARYAGSKGHATVDEAGWKHDEDCGSITVHEPKCSPTRIWQRAIKNGAPNPAMAKITAAVMEDGSIHWWLTIESAKWDFDDNC
jgi:hypothetical protein